MKRLVANFVMEIGLDSDLPTYSGGLGILAGDMAYSFADLDIPAVFVTLLYNKGYTSQRLDDTTGQNDFDSSFEPGAYLKPMETRVEVPVGGQVVKVGAWEYAIKSGSAVRVIFLDTNAPDNDESSRSISDRLYRGDLWHRLTQEIVLGVAGYRMLGALGVKPDIYQLNESHSAFLTLEALHDLGSVEAVKRRCVFTTHTPVLAGYEIFPRYMVSQAFAGYDYIDWNAESSDDRVDLTRLALKYSGVATSVSLKHKFVTERLLDYHNIAYVTNGIYHKRWVHSALKKLYDLHIPGWEKNPSLLSSARTMPSADLAESRMMAKNEMVEMVRQRTGLQLDSSKLTIGLAKRITGYKRNNLVLEDLDRLIAIGDESEGFQILLAGKAHPQDDVGKAMIRYMLQRANEINRRTNKIRVVYLENYDINVARALVSGCDVWLNTPRRPLEACGTSGMKAAMNGGVNFSTYDGWWLEAALEGINGWAIGTRSPWNEVGENIGTEDLQDLYSKLSKMILPTYYGDKHRWIDICKNSIATVGPHFNSYRMIEEYVARVYANLPD